MNPGTPRVLPYGERALLVELFDLNAVLVVDAAVRRSIRDTTASAGWAQVVDAVAGAETLLLTVAGFEAVSALRPLLAELLAGLDLTAAPPPPQRVVQVPVRYDGPDLNEVARGCGLSETEVVERHTSGTWRVAFGGFAPGFAYLAGGDRGLTVPRRSEPRERVPTGAVGLAGAFSGVYPRPSPGGWQLIGSTDVTLWEAKRDPPALLQPGVSVQFVDVGSP